MSIEVSTDKAVCTRCGVKYGGKKGYFPVSYASSYKGNRYLPICKKCIESMYSSYLSQCNDKKTAVRQMCRKLDLYWNEKLFESADAKSTTKNIMSQYITKTNISTYAGRCYDDTLLEEGTMWNFCKDSSDEDDDDSIKEKDITGETCTEKAQAATSTKKIKKSIREFWGDGYTQEMYDKLEKWKETYIEKLKKQEGMNKEDPLSVGQESLIRQICRLEVKIADDNVMGKSVHKDITLLNTLLGSLNVKPTQNKEETESTTNDPLGVWTYRYENERPLPDIDDDLKDVNKIRKYVFTWLGHVCKMLNKKNAYSDLYEEELKKWKVEKPNYDDEELEEIFDFSEEQSEEQSEEG